MMLSAVSCVLISLFIVRTFIPSKTLSDFVDGFVWLYTGILLLTSVWPLFALACKRLVDIGISQHRAIWLVFSFMLIWFPVVLLLDPLFFSCLPVIFGLFGIEGMRWGFMFFDLPQTLRSRGVDPSTITSGIWYLTLAVVLWLGVAPSNINDVSD